ncbi:MAG TPA: CoA transferase [Burkholderiales bacterium]|nr:CoA transferase [Burkholderiales bacterium]
MQETFLEPIAVVELGDRLATGLCGGLLQRLGAAVYVVEPSNVPDDSHSKWPHRALLGAGKSSVALDADRPADVERVCALLERCDAVVTSSDWRSTLPQALHAALERVPVICDVTAFGASGPLAGAQHTDGMVQAFSGMMATTGDPQSDPVATRVPIAECTSAVFAAAAIVAALRARRASGEPQRAEVALFDVAVSMLATFLPKYFDGGAPTRIGNRHPSMSPWNAYHARDGWLLLCSASNDMWGRVCEVVGQPELKLDPRFATMGGRVANADEADASIAPWIAAHSVAECLEAFNRASVPCGPVYELAAVLEDRNVHARSAVCEIAPAGSAEALRVPGALFHGAPAEGVAPMAALAPAREIPERQARSRSKERGPLLEGLRVLEMGSYTTAPLAARNLGAFGADVVKLEPPAGELSRVSPPYRDGQSYLCTLSNSDKRCVVVDLRTDQGRALFRALLEKADVFVENMKPGALDRFGFGADALAALNPRLVYCSISGYGAGSPLADLPAMDTTIQGMAGVMDLTRRDGIPYKTGVSISDLLGGQFALLAILAALDYRDRTGAGQFIDLSMQELSVWLTQLEWNGDGPQAGSLLRCLDGDVYVEGPQPTEFESSALTRDAALAALRARGVRCAPVSSVSEAAGHAQTRARELIVERPAGNGRVWPLLACPIRLAPVGPTVRRALGAVGEDGEEVMRDWGVDPRALSA